MNLYDELEEVIAELTEEAWLQEVRRSGDGTRYLAIYPLIYTHAIICGVSANSHDDRWCYQSYAAAKAALDAWDGAEGTEPQGWHRHPSSGRRRPDGDATREYVNQ